MRLAPQLVYARFMAKRILSMKNAKVVPSDCWSWLDEIAGPVDDAFAEAACEQPPARQRPELDFFDSDKSSVEDWEMRRA